MRIHHDADGARGFTLIELLIALGIIGMLSAFIIQRVTLARERAKIARAQTDVGALVTAVGLLEHNTNEWPGHWPAGVADIGVGGNEMWDLNGQIAGLTDTDGAYALWDGPYVPAVPNDPWGHPYFFDPDYDVDPGAGTRWAAVVGSFGPNGVGQNVFDSDNLIQILKSD